MSSYATVHPPPPGDTVSVLKRGSPPRSYEILIAIKTNAGPHFHLLGFMSVYREVSVLENGTHVTEAATP